jgi:hypothetical protein
MKDGIDISKVDPSLLNQYFIYSLKEYQQIFGGAKEEGPDAFDITVNEKQDEQGNVTGFELSYKPTATISHYRLYYAIQMYFANGGGKCYIMSAGNYGTAIDEPKLSAGLEKIKLLDETHFIDNTGSCFTWCS